MLPVIWLPNPNFYLTNTPVVPPWTDQKKKQKKNIHSFCTHQHPHTLYSSVCIECCSTSVFWIKCSLIIEHSTLTMYLLFATSFPIIRLCLCTCVCMCVCVCLWIWYWLFKLWIPLRVNWFIDRGSSGFFLNCLWNGKWVVFFELRRSTLPCTNSPHLNENWQIKCHNNVVAISCRKA